MNIQAGQQYNLHHLSSAKNVTNKMKTSGEKILLIKLIH